MKVWIETDQCTGAGLCELIEERVFVLGEDGLARVRQDGRVLPPGPGSSQTRSLTWVRASPGSWRWA